MGNQDRIRQLEQMGLELHQAWLGGVTGWQPATAITALGGEVMPNSREMVRELILMQRSWGEILVEWGRLLDNGMPWHWNGMLLKSDATEGKTAEPNFSREQKPLHPSMPNQQGSSVKRPDAFSSLNPPRTRDFPTGAPAEGNGERLGQNDSAIVRERSERGANRMGEPQKNGSILPNEDHEELKTRSKLAEGEGKDFENPISKPEDGSMKSGEDNAASSHHHPGRKMEDEGKQVTFRRFDDFAAMLGKSGGITPAQEDPRFPDQLQNKVNLDSNPAMQKVPLAPKGQEKSTSAAIQNQESMLTDRSRTQAGDGQPHRFPIDQLPENERKPAAMPTKDVAPSWDALQSEWERALAPQLSESAATDAPLKGEGKPSKNLGTAPQEAPRPIALPEDQEASEHEPSLNAASLKPVSSRYEVKLMPPRRFGQEREETAAPQMEIEDLVDQLVEQLHRDFKRYYGG